MQMIIAPEATQISLTFLTSGDGYCIDVLDADGAVIDNGFVNTAGLFNASNGFQIDASEKIYHDVDIVSPSISCWCRCVDDQVTRMWLR